MATLKTETQREREHHAAEIAFQEASQREAEGKVSRGHLLVQIEQLVLEEAMDATLHLVAGRTRFRMRHMDAGFFSHKTRNPIFGHVAKWEDPPENAQLILELRREGFLGSSQHVVSVPFAVNLRDCARAWKPINVDLGRIGTAKLRAYFLPVGGEMPKDMQGPYKEAPVTDEDSLWFLARDVDDPVGTEPPPEDAGAPISAAAIEIPELRRHAARLLELATHIKHVIMWRASISESLLILFSVLVFGYYDMLLSGLSLLVAALCVWSFIRHKTGLDQLDDQRVFATESERAAALNRARRLTRTLRKVNELIATATQLTYIDSIGKLRTLTLWCLGGALFTAVVPLRWILMLGCLYLFTVQSAYLNFPNLKRRYYWPEMLRGYLLQARTAGQNLWVRTAPPWLLQWRAEQSPLRSQPIPPAAAAQMPVTGGAGAGQTAGAAALTGALPAAAVTQGEEVASTGGPVTTMDGGASRALQRETLGAFASAPSSGETAGTEAAAADRGQTVAVSEATVAVPAVPVAVPAPVSALPVLEPTRSTAAAAQTAVPATIALPAETYTVPATVAPVQLMPLPDALATALKTGADGTAQSDERTVNRTGA